MAILSLDPLPGKFLLIWGLHLSFISFLSFSFFLFFWGRGVGTPQHMEVPRLGVEFELYLMAYATARAMWDPSQVCIIYHSSQPHLILKPLSKARDQTHVLRDTSWFHYH